MVPLEQLPSLIEPRGREFGSERRLDSGFLTTLRMNVLNLFLESCSFLRVLPNSVPVEFAGCCCAGSDDFQHVFGPGNMVSALYTLQLGMTYGFSSGMQ